MHSFVASFIRSLFHVIHASVHAWNRLYQYSDNSCGCIFLIVSWTLLRVLVFVLVITVLVVVGVVVLGCSLVAVVFAFNAFVSLASVCSSVRVSCIMS